MGNPYSKEEIAESHQYKACILLEREKCAEFLHNALGIKAMTGVVAYTAEITKERSQQITIPTVDEIGIIFDQNKLHITEYDYTKKTPKEINTYLQSAITPERMKFYREMTYMYIISKQYDGNIKNVVIKSLLRDHLEREAWVLRNMYD